MYHHTAWPCNASLLSYKPFAQQEAFGEAIGQGQKALAEVILRCMSQKVSPIAEPSERLAFYLSQDLTTTQGDYHYYYLKQEASKNFKQAFRAFYQGLPHGIVAHFAANSAILEAIPQDYEVIPYGGACEKLKNCLEFKSFFDGHLVHYQVLLESIESHFLSCFLEARTVMECLFVAPYISSLGWLQKWEEMREESHLQSEIGLEGCRLSNAILMEVREMLRRSQSSYQASIEGQNGNELILEWKGTQLVRVSTWEN